MSDFAPFALNVHTRFNQLAKAGELFVVNVDKDAFWAAYLAAFPKGTNPIFRTNTEHDCSCCRNFVKNIGNVVAFDSTGQFQTVWDNWETLREPYRTVSQAMAYWVAAKHLESGIATVFRSAEPSYGAEHTKELHVDGSVHRWSHFHTGALIPYFYKGKDAAQARGAYNTNQQTLMRALTELTPEAVDQVLSLIDANALYRGEEKRDLVAHFQTMQNRYRALPDMSQRNIFTWKNAGDKAAYFRNDVIGTLVVDLSEGVELEKAVKTFEAKVAPMNYRRTTALITPRMVQDAAKTIETLGLEPALKRRFAKLSDVSVNNVLWVDGGVKDVMKGGIAGLLAGEVARAPKRKPDANAANTPIAAFMKDILPTALGIELLVQNQHQGNFVALTTADDERAANLFTWPNSFAWSYSGNVADSIRERVKKAGGNVDAPLRFSLSWFNADDLDLHVHAPRQGHIYFGAKQGILDVDTNGGGPHNYIDPVENVSFRAGAAADGTYVVRVHQFRKAVSTMGGFDFEIFTNGGPRFFSYKSNLREKEFVDVATVIVKHGVIVDWKLNPALVEGSSSQTKWGVNTETYVPVQTVMHSPNHWDDNMVGNRHWFFFLEGCKSDETMRGFYNEFLRADLAQHRKVFEILGDKTKCPMASEQLAGLGFSSTKPETITLRVKHASSTRVYNVTI